MIQSRILYYKSLHTSVKASVKLHTKSIWMGPLDLYGPKEPLQPYKTMPYDETNDMHCVLHAICCCCMLLQVKH